MADFQFGHIANTLNSGQRAANLAINQAPISDVGGRTAFLVGDVLDNQAFRKIELGLNSTIFIWGARWGNKKLRVAK